MNDMIQTGFDYAALPVSLVKSDIEYLEHCAFEVELGAKITSEGVLRMGKALNLARAKFGDNDKAFGRWRNGRFPWLDPQKALVCQQAHQRFGSESLLQDNLGVEKLSPTVLYVLAAPSTPDAVIDKALEKAESGEKVTVADVKDWKAELETEKQRTEEFRIESNERRKKIREMEEQIDLLTTRDRMMQGRLEKADEEIKYLATVVPAPKKIEVPPADYETAKAKAAELERELAKVKDEQATLINNQVKAKLREYQSEVDEMEQRKEMLQEQVDRMKTYMASLESDAKRAEVHQSVINGVRLELINLAAFLNDEESIQDTETLKRWRALANMLGEAMTAIHQYVGDAKPQLTVIPGGVA